MRIFLLSLASVLGMACTGCEVKVEDKTPRIIERDKDKDVDIKIKTPRVDVNVD